MNRKPAPQSKAGRVLGESSFARMIPMKENKTFTTGNVSRLIAVVLSWVDVTNDEYNFVPFIFNLIYHRDEFCVRCPLVPPFFLQHETCRTRRRVGIELLVEGKWCQVPELVVVDTVRKRPSDRPAVVKGETILA